MIGKALRLLRWSLRKLRLPIGLKDLVIEVGSGGNPHPASKILAEKFVDSSHRLKAIRIDRQVVLADACRTPFRSGLFDYSIAFHVLEHVADPAGFIGEMMRISKAGYIETPNFLYERFFPLGVHLLELALVDRELVIYRKPAAVHDEFAARNNPVKHDRTWAHLFASYPELFHVCYEWVGEARFRVVNPQQSLEWHKFPEAGLDLNDALIPGTGTASSEGFSLRQAIIGAIRWIYVKFGTRDLDLDSILVCPDCHGELDVSPEFYTCPSCQTAYRRRPLPDFTKPVNAAASDVKCLKADGA